MAGLGFRVLLLLTYRLYEVLHELRHQSVVLLVALGGLASATRATCAKGVSTGNRLKPKYDLFCDTDAIASTTVSKMAPGSSAAMQLVDIIIVTTQNPRIQKKKARFGA